MTYKYRFHCNPNAIRHSEILYQDMAAEGFRLVKRGILWSKFIPDTKKELRFQLIVHTPVPTGKTKHQIETKNRRSEQYKSLKGWTYVTRRGPVFVLCTKKAEELPNYYQTEEEVEKAYKYRAKSMFRVIFSVLLAFVLGNITSFVFANSILKGLSYSLINLIIVLILHPSVLPFIVWAILDTCYEQVISHREYKDFEHELTKLSCDTPVVKQRSLAVRIGSTICSTLLFINIGLFIFSMIQPKLHHVDFNERVPFLTIRDFKDNSEQELLSYNKQTADYNNSLLCTYYSVQEDANERGSLSIYISEEYYHVKYDVITNLLMRCLLYAKPLYMDPIYEKVSIDGLDEAYQVTLDPNNTDVFEYIARKGTKILSIRCSSKSLTGLSEEDMDKVNETIWTQVAEKLNEKD